MSFFEYALIGFFVGILTTAPVGPVNIMAIQHAVHGGFRQGVFVGLGAVVDLVHLRNTSGVIGSLNMIVSSTSAYQEGCFRAVIDSGRELWLSSGM